MAANSLYAVWAVLAYLAGSVSVGRVVSRAARVDIASLGTGNPGGANVYREVGAPYGIAVIVLDIAKGAAVTAPLLLADAPGWAAGIALAALLAGQFFPVFWGFRGNTGMAACMGATVGLLPFGALIGLPVGLLGILLSRNTAWSGIAFFAVTLVAGTLLHRDPVASTIVLLGAAAVLVRALVQYRRR